MKGVLKVMDGSGHSEYPYDTDKGEGVTEAMNAFDVEMVKHSMAFTTGTGERVARFDPTEQSDVLVVPQFQGG